MGEVTRDAWDSIKDVMPIKFHVSFMNGEELHFDENDHLAMVKVLQASAGHGLADFFVELPSRNMFGVNLITGNLFANGDILVLHDRPATVGSLELVWKKHKKAVVVPMQKTPVDAELEYLAVGWKDGNHTCGFRVFPGEEAFDLVEGI